MTATPGLLALTIPNRIEALAARMDDADAFLGAWSVSPGDRAQIMVILDEIASNIIKAAWPAGGEHSLRIELSIAAEPPCLVLLAVDDGIAFDPTTMPAPDIELDIDEREPGGLGLFMVGEMSDSMAYERVDGWNRLTVTKRLERAGEGHATR